MEIEAFIKHGGEKAAPVVAYCPELAKYGVASGSGNSVASAIEMLAYGVKRAAVSLEKPGHEAHMPAALRGLQLRVEAQCKVTPASGLYIKAFNLMCRQHSGQKDKAGRDYYFHPISVSKRCRGIEAKMAALLHDTVEDTGLTFNDLRQAGFPTSVVAGVEAVTRREGESYADFIMRASHNEIGREVKIHDLEDNMDITRLPCLTETDCHRLNKYLHSWRFLNGFEPDASLIQG